jgi:hypothetical protein
MSCGPQRLSRTGQPGVSGVALRRGASLAAYEALETSAVASTPAQGERHAWWRDSCQNLLQCGVTSD